MLEALAPGAREAAALPDWLLLEEGVAEGVPLPLGVPVALCVAVPVPLPESLPVEEALGERAGAVKKCPNPTCGAIIVRYRGDEVIGLTILHASRRARVNGD